MFIQIYDFNAKAVYALPQFLAETNYRNPDDYIPAAFQIGHNTDLGFWEFLKADPKREVIFNGAMSGSSSLGLALGRIPYPFEKELGFQNGEEVVLVDVAGGPGHTLEQILHENPKLQGCVILQDQPSILADAKRNENLSKRIETQAMDLFATANPAKGARAYLLRRVLHDWGDGASVKILQNVKAAMGPHSRMLIMETVMPDMDAPWTAALSDVGMMACSGGKERTMEEFEGLLAKVGLTTKKVWSMPESLHAVLEVVLSA